VIVVTYKSHNLENTVFKPTHYGFFFFAVWFFSALRLVPRTPIHTLLCLRFFSDKKLKHLCSLSIFSTMVDCISSLPDSILCDILSSLPTKEVVATSVLSKRWYLLWRSVPSFDFDYDGDHFDYDKDKEACSHFLQSVDSFLLRRDRDEPIHRFRLKSNSLFDHTVSINKWIRAAVSGSGRVQHLALCCDWNVVMPSVVFSCKTVVVLKLKLVTLEDISFVDLPFPKILHLNSVRLSEGLNLSLLLSGCPNLEDLKVEGLIYETDVQNKEKFISLPKLVSATIHENSLPLEVVKDVEVLFLVLDMDWVTPLRYV